ncbi:MAG: hypothetical protein ABI431_05970 [Candidatus Tumulicola sp.]
MRTLPPDACLHLREALPETLSREVVAWLEERPDATLRLDSLAFQLLQRLGAAAPRRLVLGAGPPPTGLPALQRVECVTFSASKGIGGWLRRLPNARIVRVALRGTRFDATQAAGVPLAALSIVEGSVANLRALQATGLRALELRDVAVDRFDDVGALPQLRALRVSAVERVRSLSGLSGHAQLRSIWLQRLPHLERLSDLLALPSLESLELAGLWQFGMLDADVLYSLPRLARASIDIGGRRKNIEINKRLRLPPAAPFCLEREASENRAETVTT